MKINGIPYRTIWPTSDNQAVEIIDQTKLPHEFVTLRLNTMHGAERAIKDMQVRGAPLIGVTAAYGVALAMRRNASVSGPVIIRAVAIVFGCAHSTNRTPRFIEW